MDLNTKSRYAVMAMADLANDAAAAAVPLSAIAERQALPLAYLEQIFVPLRRAGLVESARGRTGGYRLARAASDITVADVMRAVDEDTQFTRCSENNPQCSRERPCLTHGLWDALTGTTTNFLKSVSLVDIVQGKFPEAKFPHDTSVTVTAAATPGRFYLDYNATAPLLTEAQTAMIAALAVTGNPSSAHNEGRAARNLVERARASVARLAGAKPSEIVFTSGASEANAWVFDQRWDTIFVAGLEHDSVLGPARANGAEIVTLDADGDGRVRVETLAGHARLEKPSGRALISLHMANNETGVIQDVARVAAFAKEHGLLVHTDAVQAPGRMPVNFAELGVDLLSLSAHKLGGPKGIGALVIRDHLDLVPLIRGGGQERRRRAGTENLAGIAGFGAAAEVALRQLAGTSRIGALRDQLETMLLHAVPETVVIAKDAPRLCNTSLVALPGKLAETMIIRLDLAGFAVSAGSACSSGKVGASHVLEAMNVPRAIASSAVRVSIGPETTHREIAAFAAAWKDLSSKPALAA